MPAPILLLTHSEDFYTPECVAEALEARGRTALRVDTDLFPTALGLEVYSGREGVKLFLSDAEGRIDLEEVPAVWYRRLYPGWIPELASDVAAARSTARRFFVDALTLLDSATWVNRVAETERAENKLLQQRAARAVGLNTPETLVTNHPAALRTFYGRLGTRMVTKLLEPRVQSMGAHPDFAYTTEVHDQDLEAVDRVRLSPQIFQALIPKQYELRVVVVGRQVFSGSIDTRQSPTGALDWRQTAPEEGIRWKAANLPEAVENQLVALNRHLGLLFSAVDIIVDEEGRHIFLELNPAGEWGWLQRDLGLPIAEAIADALIGEGCG